MNAKLAVARARGAKSANAQCGARLWTPEEDALLREFYPAHGPDYCEQRLRGRTRSAITVRASNLGVRLNEAAMSAAIRVGKAQQPARPAPAAASAPIDPSAFDAVLCAWTKRREEPRA